MPPAFRKKTYRVSGLLGDVAELVPRAPDIFQIVARSRVSPALRETVMTAVARENACRYCTFVHTEWARHAGATDDELAGVTHRDATPFDEPRWRALEYARARAAADFGPVDPDVERAAGAVLDEVERRDLETIARLMTVANRCGNTLDALLSRLRGAPDLEGRLCDELVVSSLVVLATPPVVALLSLWRRELPTTIAAAFFRFSRQFDEEVGVGGDRR